MPILTTAQTVYVQEITEPNMLGRVFSIIQIASTSALPIAILFLGPLADIISIQSMLFVSRYFIAYLRCCLQQTTLIE